MASKHSNYTPSSIAYSIFIIFIAGISFYLGIVYHASLVRKVIMNTVPNREVVDDQERKRKLIEKCGDIPRNLLGNVNIRTIEWSPDCQKIGYSTSEGGVFIYSIANKKTDIANLPSETYESAEFVHFADNDLVEFSYLGPRQQLTATYSIGFKRPISDINRF